MRTRLALLALALSTACKEEIPTALCPAGTQSIDGVCRTSCTADSDCLYDQACAATVCVPRDPTEGPKIRLFQADRIAVTTANGRVRFDYVVTNAVRVEVSPSPGVVDSVAGSFEVAITTDTTFVIRAVGADGREDTDDERITVVAPPPPGRLNVVLQVERPTENACVSVDVAWSIVGAEAPLEARLLVDGREVLRTTDASGADEVPIAGPASFQMFATSADRSGESDVLYAEPAILCSVAFAPSLEVDFGDTILFTWETQNAAYVEVIDDLVGGQVWAAPAGPGLVQGLGLVLPLGRTRYQVIAYDVSNRMDAMTFEVNIRDEPLAPPIYVFDVSPRWVYPGSGVTIAWAAALANTYGLETATSFTPLPAAVGSTTQPVQSTTEVYFRADRTNGTGVPTAGSMARRIVFVPDPEVEPNDDPNMASPVGNGRLGSIDPVSHIDWYYVDVPFGVVRLEIHDPAGMGCAGLQGVMLDLEQGGSTFPPTSLGGCPSVVLDNLGSERLNVRLELFTSGDPGVTAEYVIVADTAPIQCGDFAVEAGEKCDDGNAEDGDGCSSGCDIEPDYDYVVMPGNSLPPGRPSNVNPLEFFAVPGSGSDPKDEGFALIPVDVSFYGSRYAGLVVSTNGYVTFLPILSAEGGPLGVPAPPNAVIAGMAADLKIPQDGSVAWWIGDGDGHLAIDFSRVVVNGTGLPIDFRIRIFRDGTVDIDYPQVTPPGIEFLTGIEDATGRYFASLDGCRAGCVGASLPAAVTFTHR